MYSAYNVTTAVCERLSYKKFYKYTIVYKITAFTFCRRRKKKLQKGREIPSIFK